MKRWLSLILAVAVIAAICVFLVIRRNTSQQPQEPTEKETEQTEAEKREDWTFRGLQIDLTADYQQTQLEADRLCCSNGIYWVEIICRENEGGETKETLHAAYKEEYDAMMNDMEFRQYGSGVTDETPYVYGISMNEACTQVLAVYATEKTVWVVRVENVEGAAYELDPMIFLITGWEYRDPEVK